MNFSIVTLSSFDKELKRLSKKYPSMKTDYANLLDDLESDPKSGTPIGKNCYKVRLQITSKGKGKSGGARVITHLIVTIAHETLYLLKIYDKADQENINETELKSLIASIGNL
jgi:mRNA-degrading endonuclease RelE of RelBE toxin-antitoxin system